MRKYVDLHLIHTLDQQIHQRSTGPPEVFAQKLNIVRSSLFDTIQYLRDEMQAPILYNSSKQSYEYQYPTKFYLGFETANRQIGKPHYVDLKKMSRIDYLIRWQTTGSIETLAGRLETSRSTLLENIKYMREVMQAKIRFSPCKQSYLYDKLPNFYLGFERDRSRNDKPDLVNGGGIERQATNTSNDLGAEHKISDNLLLPTELEEVSGGIMYEARKAFLRDVDPDEVIIDEDINFNDLYMNDY